MTRPERLVNQNWVRLLMATSLAVAAGCSPRASSVSINRSTVPTAPVESSSSDLSLDAADSSKTASSSSDAAAAEAFRRALEQGASAANMSQIAQSRDDWNLVASRWQQALDLLGQVPASAPDYASAQTRIGQYGRNLQVAQQQASRTVPQPIPLAPPPPRAAVPSPASSSSPAAIAPAPPPVPSSAAAPTATAGVRVPIVRRASGTPVIRVMFNGSQPFEMIVDTGASGTLVTQQMAASLGLVPVGRASVNTASDRNISLPLGYVSSIQAGNLVANNVLVAVAGPELGIGLLGHDFFGNYDVTIRQNEVEFSPRS
ncbi:MAG: retroviral-like aspartic protease family protein [Kaiparowitsia implicata GSE-PSE-MK54-09C]|nr:retroviral-like aspartic protease family protein [Kaiparowitsia implicata GSE-PSE-MK54-09C]